VARRNIRARAFVCSKMIGKSRPGPSVRDESGFHMIPPCATMTSTRGNDPKELCSSGDDGPGKTTTGFGFEPPPSA